MKHLLAISVLSLLGTVPLAAHEPKQPVPTAQVGYAIEKIAGDVYMFSAGHFRSALLVTKEGIVLTDPCGKEAATWLRAELGRRFDAPIRYVIYSHSHPDHVYGGEVFDGPGVTFVAHRLTRQNLVSVKAKTRIPNLVFDGELDLHLGGQRIELRYHGVNNGRGSISMRFAPARVLHVVDWIVLGRMPYMDLRGYDIEGTIRSTREVLDLDFAHFIGGHGKAGGKDDVRRYLRYMETLYSEVRDGMLAGKDLETLQREITLEEFRDLPRFADWRALNIRGVYEKLRDEDYLLRRPDVGRNSAAK